MPRFRPAGSSMDDSTSSGKELCVDSGLASFLHVFSRLPAGRHTLPVASALVRSVWDCENSRISGEIGLVETEKSVALFPDMEGPLFHGWSRTWQVTRRKGRK